MVTEEMTNGQIDDYLRKFEYQHFKQLEICTDENKKLKKIETEIQKLKSEKWARSSRKQLKIGG